MVSVYIGMLFPMIAFFAVMGITFYFLVKTVRYTLSMFNAGAQSKIKQRKLPDRHLQAGMT